jgi:hypothetical protein
MFEIRADHIRCRSLARRIKSDRNVIDSLNVYDKQIWAFHFVLDYGHVIRFDMTGTGQRFRRQLKIRMAPSTV